MVARILTNQHEAKRYSLAVAFTDETIVESIQDELRISAGHAAEIFQDVKRFLYLCAAYKTPLCAPPRLDKAWHVFISFTEEYEDFCRRCLSGFVHHRPHRGLPPERGLMRTYEAAESLFGHMNQIWLPRDHEPSSCAGVFVPRRTH